MGRFYDLNNTAQEIDNILTDMGDILNSEEYNTPIVLKPASQEQGEKNRPHFDTGEAGRNIQASLNQMLKGDGNGWAQGSSYNDLFISDEDTENGKQAFFFKGPQYIPASESAQSNLITNEFYFGGGEGVVEKIIEKDGQEITVKEFSTDCHLKISDFAKAEFDNISWFGIHGEAQLDIGEKDKVHNGHTLWRNTANETLLKAPTMYIHDAAYLVIDDAVTHAAPPVMTIHGGCMIDISDSLAFDPGGDAFVYKRLENPAKLGNKKTLVAPNYEDDTSESTGKYYPHCPWSTGKNWSDKYGPIFWMHSNPTFMMQDAAVIDMRGHGVIFFDEQDSRLLMKQNSVFEMDNETRIRMHGKAPSGSNPGGSGAINVDDGEVYMGKIKYESSYDGWTSNYWEDWQKNVGENILPHFSEGFKGNNGKVAYSATMRNASAPYGPQLLIETYPTYDSAPNNGASLHLAAKYGSTIGTERFAESSSIACDSIHAGSGSAITIEYGAEQSSIFTKTVAMKYGAVFGVKIGAEYGAKNAFVYNSNSNSDVGVGVQIDGDFTINLNPHNVYVSNSHPEYYQEYVDGDVFKQINGTSHLEMQDDSSLIMRERQYFGGEEAVKYDDIYEPITFTTSINYTNLTMADLISNTTDFSTFMKALEDKILSKLQKHEQVIEYLSGGTISSVARSSGSTYTTSVNSFYYYCKGGHVSKLWNCPIQNDGVGTGPKIQVYNSSNFLMRGPFEPSSYKEDFQITKTALPSLFTQAEIYITDPSEIQAVINGLAADERQRYDEVINSLFDDAIPILIVNKNNSYSGTSREVKVSFKVKRFGETYYSDEEHHLNRSTNSPVVEFNDRAYLFMNEDSELQLKDSSFIQAIRNTDSSSANYGKLEYTFGDNIVGGTSVSFTIDELQALKQLLSS